MEVNAHNQAQVWLTPGGPVPGGPPIAQVPGAMIGARPVFTQPAGTAYVRPPHHGAPMMTPQPCACGQPQPAQLRQSFMSTSHGALDTTLRFEQYRPVEQRQEIPDVPRQVQQPWPDARVEGRPVVPAQASQEGSLSLSAATRISRKEAESGESHVRRVTGESTSTLPTQVATLPAASRRPKGLPPFYWVPSVDLITEFEVSGACGELAMKTGSKDAGSALPIAGSLRLERGGLYLWTLQVVRQCDDRPQIHFGIQGLGHARPWRLVNISRCSRSRDDGPWLSRPGGDLSITEGDYIHCEVDFRGLTVPLGRFSFALNDGPFEVVFEDIPLAGGAMNPVVAMGGDGTMVRVCAT